ncbi:MAG: DUF3810 family protein, partial [Christensenellaceae bacterium]|nr:DUF3810 family protein [Christensenellaceae bacterium]
MIKRNLKLLPGLLPGIIAYILYMLAFRFPDIVENVYSRGIYPVFTYFSKLYGLVPISISEASIYALIAFALFYIGFIVAAFFKAKGQKLFHFIRRILCMLIAVSCAAAAFIFGWSMNYARNTLAKSMELTIKPSSLEELISVCEKLASEANENRKA